jgi:tRNA pseudouridine32 synthase/23S rRNA pseudouridine746 synthase
MREVAGAELNGSMATNSETWIDCVEQLAINGSLLQPPLAKYLLKPVTGQRHQLRVHMNALGLPLLNDQFYPQVIKGPDDTEDFSKPLQLLAKTIEFKDPVTGQPRFFESARQLSALR